MVDENVSITLVVVMTTTTTTTRIKEFYRFKYLLFVPEKLE